MRTYLYFFCSFLLLACSEAERNCPYKLSEAEKAQLNYPIGSKTVFISKQCQDTLVYTCKSRDLTIYKYGPAYTTHRLECKYGLSTFGSLEKTSFDSTLCPYVNTGIGYEYSRDSKENPRININDTYPADTIINQMIIGGKLYSNVHKFTIYYSYYDSTLKHVFLTAKDGYLRFDFKYNGTIVKYERAY